MAGWISSKLKVAESLLQQIDQQAAESLGKNEKPQKDNPLKYETRAKSESIPVKHQLKKKSPERNNFYENAQPANDPGGHIKGKKHDNSTKSILDPVSAVADNDWTELLSSQKPLVANDKLNGVSALRKDQKIRGIAVSSLVPGEGKRSVSKLGRKLDVVSENKVNVDSSDGFTKQSGDESGLLGGLSSGASNISPVQKKPVLDSQVKGNDNLLEQKEVVNTDAVIVGALENGKHYSEIHRENKGSMKEDQPTVLVRVDMNNDFKGLVDDDNGNVGNALARDRSDVAAKSSFPDDFPRSSLSSDEQSDSETNSSSTSDSDNDNERKLERRKKRERRRAEQAAAKAIEAIKELENVVARLEGEKQSLEKILDERQKQQAQEASELQMNTMETMEAVDLEKQKHNSTRMEALARLAKLETSNAELSRSLAATQWNLEVEVNQVSELRREIELKEVVCEELQRRISKIHQSASSSSQSEASKGVEFEREILQAEYSFLCDKIRQLHEKAKELEENIEITRKDMEHPTEVEVELKKRLAHLTDHLIQKQAQVEALASEKATLLFRLETVSRLLDENKSSSQLAGMVGPSASDDIESGMWEKSHMRLRPVFQDRIHSGRKHLGSILRQLDAIFSAGAVFLRRNPAAQLWSLVYLICLHFWVIYILTSHSQASDSASSGAVVSLESINKTGN